MEGQEHVDRVSISAIKVRCRHLLVKALRFQKIKQSCEFVKANVLESCIPRFLKILISVNEYT